MPPSPGSAAKVAMTLPLRAGQRRQRGNSDELLLRVRRLEQRVGVSIRGQELVRGQWHGPLGGALLRVEGLHRAALCGYAPDASHVGEGHECLEAAGWTVARWKSNGGYGSNRKRDKRDGGGKPQPLPREDLVFARLPGSRDGARTSLAPA